MQLSVIIPALNEATHIERTLASVPSQVHEVLVVDGASTDDTRVRAARRASVIQSSPGRARQMNAGAARATGDVLLFLHADTCLPPGALAAIEAALRAREVEAGSFRLRFDRDTPLLRLYAWCTHINSALISFGDRGLFVRRSVFDAIGGFPDVPIFEDLEMVRMLSRRGGFCFLDLAVVTAARRFDRHGHLRQQLQNAYLWSRYVLGTDPGRLAHLYRYDRPLA